MRKGSGASIVEAKAHFSELIYAAERKGRATTIYRRGRAVAVIAPVTAEATEPARERTSEQALAHFEQMIAHAPPTNESIRESMGRNRCD
jgi:antitoxin (DNA-binding transcriptional repressor) of toxin-antitoxin stability system